jgi:hypothetical protein
VREKEMEPSFAATAPPPESRTSTGKPRFFAARVALSNPGRRISALVAPM